MTFKEIDKKISDILIGNDECPDGYLMKLRDGKFDKDLFSDALLLWEEFDHEWWLNQGSNDPLIRELMSLYVIFVADTISIIQSDLIDMDVDEKADIYENLIQRIGRNYEE